MWVASAFRRVGNKLYERGFPIYRPLYAAYKTYADRAERRLIRTVLFPGAVAVDAGANIGIYSRFFSGCVGLTGVVHAFEPSPENFRRLRSATGKLPNVCLSRAAVGERSGRSQLYLSKKLNGRSPCIPARRRFVRHRTYRCHSLGRLLQARRPRGLDQIGCPRI